MRHSKYWKQVQVENYIKCTCWSFCRKLICNTFQQCAILHLRSISYSACRKNTTATQAPEAVQEFTRVATPEENAYIEAFHSIQQRELMDHFTFASYYDAQKHIEKYMYWYNNIRRQGALKGFTREERWAQGLGLLSGQAAKCGSPAGQLSSKLL